MAKKMAMMRKVLSCFIVFAILASVMPILCFAMNSSNNATEASNHSNDLEEAFTEKYQVATWAGEFNNSGDCAPIPDVDMPVIYLNDTGATISPLVSNDARETVSAQSCDVYVKIDDDTCVGYDVYVDGVYQFTEGQDGTPDGYCAFYVTAGTHTLEIRKNGRSATKTINFQCGITYRWVSMPDNWCIGGGEGTKTCINFDELSQGDITGQTLHYDQVDFVAEGGDSPYGGHVAVQSLGHSLPNGIGLSPGHVTASFKVPVSKVSLWVGDWAGGTTITLYAPSGWCLEEVIAQERDFTYYEFSYAGKIASVRISSSEGAFDDFCFEIEDASPCKVYVIIDDNTCTGYEVYVDGVYQFTEGQDGTPDGDCAFYVTAGTHKFELRKNGCSISKSWYCQCGTDYRWVSMPDYWCRVGDHEETCPSEVKFKGTAKTDELTGLVCYGTYYCDVVIDQILHDPDNSLKVGNVYTVGYGNNPKYIKSGDKIEVNGSFYHNCGPLNQMGRICGDVNKSSHEEVTFRGIVTGLGPYVMGSKEWYVSVDEWINGSLPCDEIDVAMRIYPPMGSCDEDINKGDNVEVYGVVDPWGGGECTVGLNGESYYIKKASSNSPPTLTEGNVNGETLFSCDTATQLIFSVTYSDPDNDDPEYVKLKIGDSFFDMAKENPGDNDYTDGCVYTYSTIMSSGKYFFTFSTSDGNHLVSIEPDLSCPFRDRVYIEAYSVVFRDAILKRGNFSYEDLLDVVDYYDCNYSCADCAYIQEILGRALQYVPEENKTLGEDEVFLEYPCLTTVSGTQREIKFIGEVIEPDNKLLDDQFDCKVEIDKILETSGDININVGDEVLVTKWWACGFNEPGAKLEPEIWNIKNGDEVEVYGKLSEGYFTSTVYHSDSSFLVDLCGSDSYYFKISPSTTSCGQILDYAISDGTYPPGQKVIADMKYKSLLSTAADFKGVFKVRSPTGDIYTYNSKKESTPAGHEDRFGYNKGNHFTIQIPEDASLGWYDAKLELRNFYTDELCDETEWLEDQFKIEPSGATGSDIRITNDPADSVNPKIAVDSNNNIHIVWEDSRDGNHYDIYYTKLDNKGNTLVDDKRLTHDAAYSSQLAIATDSTNNVHITWVDTADWIYYTKLDNDGNILVDNKKLTVLIGYDYGDAYVLGYPHIANDSSDNIHVVWDDGKNPKSELYYMKLDDNGNKLVSDKRLTFDSELSWHQDIVVDSSDNIHIAWVDYRSGTKEVYYTKLDSSGNTLIDDKKLTKDSTGPWGLTADIDSNDNIHVTWSDSREGIHGIYYSKLDKKGNILVDAKKITSSGLVYYQSMAVDSKNDIDITWRDSRDGNEEIYYTKLDNKGNTLIDDTRLTYDPAYSGFPDIAVDSNDKVHITWQDNRDGNWEIYYKTTAITDGNGYHFTISVTDSAGYNIEGAEVYIDSEYKGKTDTNGELKVKLTDGYHVVEAKKSGYKSGSWSGEFDHTSMNGVVVLLEPAELPVHNLNTGKDFATIQAAIDDSGTSPGDTITADPGTYTENVKVTKSLTIKSTSGSHKDTSVQAQNPDDPVFEVTADDVTISGFTVDGGLGSNGIYLNSVKNCAISNNNCSGHWAIVLGDSSNNDIISNNCSNNDVGISLWNSNNNALTGNNVTSNYIGIEIGSSSGNILTENTLLKNNWNGVYLQGTNNELYHNNFISDSASDGGTLNRWDNGYPSGGNYWSDYKDKYPDAKEIDEGGIWDIPYDISGGAKDNYPLMEPCGEKKGLPDLTLLPEDITFSNPNPSLEETIAITATIHNIGEADVNKQFFVSFFEGPPENNVLIDAVPLFNVDAKVGTAIAAVSYKIESVVAPEIFVVVDSNEDIYIDESNELNNIASRILDIIPGKILPVPYFNQGSTGWCTLNSIAMVLQYSGVKDHSWDLAREFNQGHDGAFDTVFDEIKDKKLTNYIENKNLALRVDGVVFPASLPFFISYIKNPIDAGKPIIISYHRIGVGGHSIVIVGYSIKDGTKYVYIHDPSGAFFSDADNMFIKVLYQNLYNDLAPLPLFYTFEISGESPDPPQEVIWVEDRINWDEYDYGDITHTVIKPSDSGLEESYILLDEGLKYKTKEILIPGFPEPPMEASWLRFLDKPQEGWTDTNNLYVAYHVSNPHPYPIDCQVCAEIQDISSGEILHEPKCKPLSVDKQTKGYDVILLDLEEIPIDIARTCNLMIKSDNDEIGPIKINFVTPTIAKKYLPNIYQLQCDIDEPADNGFIKVGYIIKEIGEDEARIEYNLVFKDEDHPDPILDEIYDVERKWEYGRIEDIEGFSITVDLNNDKIKEIEFDGTWSNGEDYNDSTHRSKTFTDLSEFNSENGHIILNVASWNHLFSNKVPTENIPSGCSEWTIVADYSLSDEKFVNKDRKELEDEYKG